MRYTDPFLCVCKVPMFSEARITTEGAVYRQDSIGRAPDGSIT